MDEKRLNAGWIAVPVGLIVLLGMYVAGYFALGTATEFPAPPAIYALRFRVFDYAWQAAIYRPLATVETFVTGTKVELSTAPP